MYSEYIEKLILAIEHQRKQKKLTKDTYEKRVEETEKIIKESFDKLNVFLLENRVEKTAAFSEIQNAVLDSIEKSRKKFLPIKTRAAQEEDKVIIALILVPTIRKMESENTEEFVELLKNNWNKRYPDSPFKLAEYNKIYNGFEKKLLGIF